MTIDARFSIRPVRDEDIPIICGFPQSPEELYFMYPKGTYPLTPDQLVSAIKERAESTVFLYDTTIAGFANFYVFETGGRCAIGNVVVNPDVRNKGVAKFIITTMMDIAKINYQATEVQVSCFNHNTAALLLYPSMGFLPFSVEERVDFSGKRVAVIHMLKKLTK